MSSEDSRTRPSAASTAPLSSKQVENTQEDSKDNLRRRHQHRQHYLESESPPQRLVILDDYYSGGDYSASGSNGESGVTRAPGSVLRVRAPSKLQLLGGRDDASHHDATAPVESTITIESVIEPVQTPMKAVLAELLATTTPRQSLSSSSPSRTSDSMHRNAIKGGSDQDDDEDDDSGRASSPVVIIHHADVRDDIAVDVDVDHHVDAQVRVDHKGHADSMVDEDDDDDWPRLMRGYSGLTSRTSDDTPQPNQPSSSSSPTAITAAKAMESSTSPSSTSSHRHHRQHHHIKRPRPPTPSSRFTSMTSKDDHATPSSSSRSPPSTSLSSSSTASHYPACGLSMASLAHEAAAVGRAKAIARAQKQKRWNTPHTNVATAPTDVETSSSSSDDKRVLDIHRSSHKDEAKTKVEVKSKEEDKEESSNGSLDNTHSHKPWSNPLSKLSTALGPIKSLMRDIPAWPGKLRDQVNFLVQRVSVSGGGGVDASHCIGTDTVGDAIGQSASDESDATRVDRRTMPPVSSALPLIDQDASGRLQLSGCPCVCHSHSNHTVSLDARGGARGAEVKGESKTESDLQESKQVDGQEISSISSSSSSSTQPIHCCRCVTDDALRYFASAMQMQATCHDQANESKCEVKGLHESEVKLNKLTTSEEQIIKNESEEETTTARQNLTIWDHLNKNRVTVAAAAVPIITIALVALSRRGSSASSPSLIVTPVVSDSHSIKPCSTQVSWIHRLLGYIPSWRSQPSSTASQSEAPVQETQQSMEGTRARNARLIRFRESVFRAAAEQLESILQAMKETNNIVP